MNTAKLLVEAYGRLRPLVHGAAEGLGEDELVFRVDGEANSIAWLIWHLSRVQDHHLAQAAAREQIWTSSEWPERFGLPAQSELTGYGDSADQVALVRAESAELLTGYYDAVHERTIEYLGSLSDADLDRVVDTSYDPPVTLGVRLVSVLGDDLQHIGQAAFIRGITERR